MTLSDRRRLGERPGRQAYEAVVRLRCPGRTRVHTGFLKNLSHAGMFLRILDPEAPGVRIGFDVYFTDEAGHREVLTGEGEVAWSRQEYEGPDLPPGMGIRFSSLEAGGADLLSRILSGGGISAPAASVQDPFAEVEEASFSGTSVSPRTSDMAAGLDAGATGDGVESGSSEVREPREGRAVAPWIVGILGIALSIAGWVWWLDSRPEVESPVPSNGGEPSARSSTESPPDPGWPQSEPPPSKADVERMEPAADDEALEAAPVVVAEPIAAVENLPVRRVLDARIEAGETLTLVEVEGDGAFALDRVNASYIGGEAPRIVVAIQGVERAGDGLERTATTGWVRSLRTGYHLEPNGQEGRLHVVLDTTERDVRVLRFAASGSELLIYVGLDRGADDS